MKTATLSRQYKSLKNNPNHNLFKNGNLWWIQFTIHKVDYTAERVRYSLGTDDIATARLMRDAIFHDLNIKSL